MTSLAYMLQWKSPSQDYFWSFDFYLSSDFHFFMALFTTSGMEQNDKITFCWKVSETTRNTKRQFPKDGVRRVLGAIGTVSVEPEVLRYYSLLLLSVLVQRCARGSLCRGTTLWLTTTY